MTNQTEPTTPKTTQEGSSPVDPLVSGKQLGAEIIGRYSVDQLLDLPVRYKNVKTGRMKNGKIDQISSGAARIMDNSYLVVWVPWHEVYCR